MTRRTQGRGSVLHLGPRDWIDALLHRDSDPLDFLGRVLRRRGAPDETVSHFVSLFKGGDSLTVTQELPTGHQALSKQKAGRANSLTTLEFELGPDRPERTRVILGTFTQGRRGARVWLDPGQEATTATVMLGDLAVGRTVVTPRVHAALVQLARDGVYADGTVTSRPGTDADPVLDLRVHLPAS